MIPYQIISIRQVLVILNSVGGSVGSGWCWALLGCVRQCGVSIVSIILKYRVHKIFPFYLYWSQMTSEIHQKQQSSSFLWLIHKPSTISIYHCHLQILCLQDKCPKHTHTHTYRTHMHTLTCYFIDYFCFLQVNKGYNNLVEHLKNSHFSHTVKSFPITRVWFYGEGHWLQS